MNTAMTEAKGQMLHAVPCLERASDCGKYGTGYRQACIRGAGGRPLPAGVHQAKGSPNVLPVCYPIVPVSKRSRKSSAHTGSNCFPAFARISFAASLGSSALRYGLFEVIAS